MKLLTSTLLLTFLFNNFLLNQRPVVFYATEPLLADTTETTDSIAYLSIAAVGDLMCHSTQFKYVLQKDGTYDFSPCFAPVAPILQAADFCIGNLETTLAGTGRAYSGYPQFNSPDDYVKAIYAAGFDMLVTANNHSNDTGEKGVLRTLEVLDSTGLMHSGTYSSKAARDKPQIINLQGIATCVLSYTYGTNGWTLPAGKDWLVNQIDSSLIQSDISNARKDGAELVIVFFHFGDEYTRRPNNYQIAYANWAVENGADIILGSHPHVLQPAGFFLAKNAAVDTGFIAWSLGNFISNQRDNYTDEGIILHLSIEKNLRTNQIRISDASYTPTWVYRGNDDRLKKHIVFPARDTLPDVLPLAFWKEMDLSVLHTADLMENFHGIIFGIE